MAVPVRVEGDGGDGCAGVGEGGTEEFFDMKGAAVPGAAPVVARINDHRVAAVRLGKDLFVQGRGVVRAEQPQRDVRRHRHVQQRLVQLRLGDLVRVPGGPDRFADPADRAAGPAVPVGEVPPCGDDQGRVVAEGGC